MLRLKNLIFLYKINKKIKKLSFIIQLKINKKKKKKTNDIKKEGTLLEKIEVKKRTKVNDLIPTFYNSTIVLLLKTFF